jgi:predicted HAD superfamily Cof-like phosphohydrolase
MEEAKALNGVSLFHKTFNHPIENDPVIPSKNRCELRLNLLKEELKELEEAIANNDIVEVADAFCDIQYVLAGAILEFGLGGKFSELFEEVQRSNMSKVCKNEEEALATIDFYSGEGQIAHLEKKGDFYIVCRESDNKILKSINYSQARLGEILKT